MMRSFLALCMFTAISSSLGYVSDALAAEKAVMYSCGTRAAGGSFYSDAGTLQCEDGLGADKTVVTETEKDSHAGAPIFCMYSATCTVVTANVQQVVLTLYNERAFKKRGHWQELTDDEMNQTVITAINNRLLPNVWQEATVQCMGKKFANGSPDCPGVNDCINNKGKNSALHFLKNYDKSVPVVTDSKGFRLRKVDLGAPTGVKQ